MKNRTEIPIESIPEHMYKQSEKANKLFNSILNSRDSELNQVCSILADFSFLYKAYEKATTEATYYKNALKESNDALKKSDTIIKLLAEHKNIPISCHKCIHCNKNLSTLNETQCYDCSATIQDSPFEYITPTFDRPA